MAIRVPKGRRKIMKPKAVCVKCRKPIQNERLNVRNYINHFENNERVAGFELCDSCIDDLYDWLFPELSEDTENADD